MIYTLIHQYYTYNNIWQWVQRIQIQILQSSLSSKSGNICEIYKISCILNHAPDLRWREEIGSFMGQIDYTWVRPGAISIPQAHVAQCCLVFISPFALITFYEPKWIRQVAPITARRPCRELYGDTVRYIHMEMILYLACNTDNDTVLMMMSDIEHPSEISSSLQWPMTTDTQDVCHCWN